MDEYIKIIDAFTKDHVKASRYEHSVRVAQTCSLLCQKYGLNPKLGYLAGIGHDMCKDFPEEEMIKLSKEGGSNIPEFELERPQLLHGRAAAALLKSKFGIDDADLLEAVTNHTSACPNLCDLTKCLFVADKIEPGRPQSTKEYRARLFAMNINQLFYTVLLENYEYVKAKGYDLYPKTLELIEEYKKYQN
ncbi:MAG: bis(5'-nucleosyl)-tetraphosphatase (symmetrical) YqeK [Treponema sp.]|nr:bis(5'-nucleosyl)-tetraphosphatase (symmetrical) YqeK [Treponema sp.]